MQIVFALTVFNTKITFVYLQENKCVSGKGRKTRDCGGGEAARDGIAYSNLLRNELLGTYIDGVRSNSDDKRNFNQSDKPNLFQVCKFVFTLENFSCQFTYANI